MERGFGSSLDNRLLEKESLRALQQLGGLQSSYTMAMPL